MKIINLLINERLLKAELAVNEATSDDIIELCRTYLDLLAGYRDHLRGLRNIPEINLTQASTLGRELVEQARKAVRDSVEITVREHNRASALLESFTSITNRQAAETFNVLKYREADNWEASSLGVHRKLSDGRTEKPRFQLAAVGPSGSHTAGPGLDHLSLNHDYTKETPGKEISVEQFSVEEAIDIASRLRRDAYIDRKITFFR